MKLTHKLLYVVLTSALLAPLAVAQDRQVFGWELMTQQERNEHRNTMRSFKTEQEREQYRKEHHKKMQVRAKEQGVKLPDEPLPRGKGMGRGPGGGGGPGPGGGMGRGR